MRHALLLLLTLLAACAPQENVLGTLDFSTAGGSADVGVIDEELLALPCDPGRARLKWWLGQNYGCSGWTSAEVGTCNAHGQSFYADVNQIGTGYSGDFVVDKRPSGSIGFGKWLKAKCTCTTSPTPQCVVTYNP